MNKFNVQDNYYDERNDRYITILKVNPESKTCYCEVIEPEYDEQGNELDETKTTALFTFIEMSHFERREV